MESENAPGRAWPEGFPSVMALAHTWEMQEHMDYKAAKGGDREAGARLVLDVTKGETQQNMLRELAEKYPDAIVVPVHAEEMEGRNQIPSLLAEYIGDLTGLEVDNNIVQSDRVGRTDSGAWDRMAYRPSFDGEVQAGKKYIIVDDVVTQGGTLSEMRRYIEANGGEAVQMITIGAARNSTIIALSEKNRIKLVKRYGEEILRVFLKEVGLYGGSYESLTASEARQLMEAGSLDEARNRIFEARQKGNNAIRAEILSRARSEEDSEINAEGRSERGGPVYGHEAPLD
ncbi:MAG: phosphoribosyltransferase [Synergistaceae bacterium]|jgi:hypothetical protein|nr:phosphoribosyltransferase [Synergistaceae bacterium]